MQEMRSDALRARSPNLRRERRPLAEHPGQTLELVVDLAAESRKVPVFFVRRTAPRDLVHERSDEGHLRPNGDVGGAVREVGSSDELMR